MRAYPAYDDTPETPLSANDNASSLPILNLSRLQAVPPAREWAVPDRIPLRQPTLWTGKGGGGKTMLALQLSAATVVGRPWLGMQPQQGGVVYLAAEDDADELHRRIAAIAEHYGVNLATLQEL